MSVEPLPEYLVPRRLARSGAKFAGEIPLARFRRFSAEVPDSGGSLAVALEFSVDEQGRTCVSGELAATVRLTCQRCLGPVDVDLRCSLLCAVVTDDEAAVNLPRAYEPLLMTGDRIALVDLLEDDLILGLPAQPRHPEGECAAPQTAGDDGHDNERAKRGEPEAEARDNPFAKLGSLRKKH